MQPRSAPVPSAPLQRLARATLVAGALALSACREHSATASPRTLRFGWNEPVGTLEPPNARGLADQNFLRLVFEGLTRSSSTGALEPALAIRWETTDQRIWRFHLAPDRRFNDGTPVRADAVVRAWTALARIAAARPGVFALIPITGIRDVMEQRTDSVRGLRALDSLTVEITLDTPMPELPQMLSRAEYLVKAPASRPDRPVGSGPWTLLSGRPGDSTLVLVRAGRPVAVDADTLQLIVTPTTEVAAAFRDRRIDCSDQVVPSVRSELALRSDVVLDVTPAAGIARLALRTNLPPLRDLRIRQALALAIDRDGIAARMAESNVSLTGSRIPRLLAPHPSPPPALPYDPRRARALLHEAGADSLALRLARWPYWLAGDSTHDVLTAIRDYWRAVGIRAELVTPPDFWRSLIDSTTDVQPQYVYPSAPDPVAFMRNLYAPATARSDLVLTATGDAPRYRAALDAAQAEPTGRDRHLATADSLLAARAVDVLLWQVPLVSARHRSIRTCRLGLYTDRPPSVSLPSRR